ncbi:sulfatase family protein [Zobellia alginiliquefaciens]|uniref:sulfatase family protein n=1 Tax=Zobellia alginiliquefaciens TaxID=3032586 RepID=UPI0023E3DF7C|nr:sulfatase [Zobellia alginiliquefaciens]
MKKAQPYYPLKEGLLAILLTVTLSCKEKMKIAAQADNPPNIVFILADDMGYADLNIYGAPYATPNLNSLAQEGMKLTNFYSFPNCSPTRAALMTGSYPQRVGMPRVVGPNGPAWTEDLYRLGLNPNETTLAEMLGGNGYTTAAVGKWHLGHQIEHLPINHGFDTYFGLPYSNDMHPPNNPEWPDLPLIQDSLVIELNPDQRTLTKRYTDFGLDFIDKNKEKPFFLYLAHTMPHVPLYVPDSLRGSSKNGLYADVIQDIDRSVGRIQNYLKIQGLLENTLIIFTSDNGPWLQFGNHAGSAGPFKAGKHTIFEGGMRVPFIASWPKRIPKGKVSGEVVSIMDMYSTIREITNSPKQDLKQDGTDVSSVLLDNGRIGQRDFYYFKNEDARGIRSGDWKLFLPYEESIVDITGSGGIRGTSMKVRVDTSLYNISKDLGETLNLKDSFPDVTKELTLKIIAFDSIMKKEARMPGMAKN